jgi:[glutamine synthetase] adenylyltransferase / [glutamine synthetase]-adenylyl-L-tyrosine phosphorylase
MGTLAGTLARMGFADPARAQHLIMDELGFDADGADADVLAAVAAAADPDLALSALSALVQRADPALATELRAALRTERGFRDRLAAVLGASAALGEHLHRHPADWRVLRGPDALRRPAAGELRAALLTAVDAQPYDGEPVAAGATAPDPVTALRRAYRRRLLHLAARDLTGAAEFEDVNAELADLAAAALEGALAIARGQLRAGDARGGKRSGGVAAARLAVIGMGKCGGRELNYVSDVDVIFVAEAGPGPEDPGREDPGPKDSGPEDPGPEDTAGTQIPGASEADALAAATKLATAMMRGCSQSAPEPPLWQVDANLRPEGRSGPLVRTLASHRAYYERWAKTWEFQALLKARPIAGDLELGARYVEVMAPLVWHAAQRDNFVEDVQAMRRRVEDTVPREQAGRQLKLGPGGLRDIEFAVQLLQLVHGRTDERVRSPATLQALAALSRGGYVGRGDAADLAAAYLFLRRVEHLLQLEQLRRTHVIPAEADTAGRRRLGRALRAYQLLTRESAGRPPAVSGPVPFAAGSRGVASPGQYSLSDDSADTRLSSADPAAEFTAQWRKHTLVARRLHEKLFYRPLLQAVARLPGEAARLTPAAARERLEALGYQDPAGALRHIEALTAGVSRRAAIQRTLLPVMLGWFASAAQPDAGLLAFRQVSEELGETPWYLRLLRDEAQVAERMAFVLASSRYATALLLRAPEAVQLLGDDAELNPRPLEALTAEALAAVSRHDSPEDAVAAARALRRRELLRTAVAALIGRIGVEETGEALTTITAVTVTAALEAAIKKIEFELRGPLPTTMSVVAMGRFGGHEMGFASDADVMFVHEPVPGADEGAATRAAHAVAEELRRLLAIPAADPPLTIDPDLRPEGRQGPLVRTLAAYAAYYRRWSAAWESQALLRAEPVAGDQGLGERFLALTGRLRYPDGGIDRAAVREIRRIKARIEAERLPRGADPVGHLKLGRGGLADVEWVVQLLQLRHAYATPGLRTTRTLAALDAAAEAGLIAPADAEVLATAWRLATRIRDAVVLVRGRPGDTLPTLPRELSAVARVLGYRPGESGKLLDDQRRAARRARAVMERIFYD